MHRGNDHETEKEVNMVIWDAKNPCICSQYFIINGFIQICESTVFPLFQARAPSYKCQVIKVALEKLAFNRNNAEIEDDP